VKREDPNLWGTHSPDRRAMPFQLFFKCAASCLVLIDNDAELPFSEVRHFAKGRIFLGTAIVSVGRFGQSVVRVKEHDLSLAYRLCGFRQPALTLRAGGQGPGKKARTRGQDIGLLDCGQITAARLQNTLKRRMNALVAVAQRGIIGNTTVIVVFLESVEVPDHPEAKVRFCERGQKRILGKVTDIAHVPILHDGRSYHSKDHAQS